MIVLKSSLLGNTQTHVTTNTSITNLHDYIVLTLLDSSSGPGGLYYNSINGLAGGMGNWEHFPIDFSVYAQLITPSTTTSTAPAVYDGSGTITLPIDGRIVRWAYNSGDSANPTTYIFENEKNHSVVAPAGYIIQLGARERNLTTYSYTTSVTSIASLHDYILTLPALNSMGHGDIRYWDNQTNTAGWLYMNIYFTLKAVEDPTRSFNPRNILNTTRVISKNEVNDLNMSKTTRQVTTSSRSFQLAPAGKILTYKDYNVMIGVFNGLDVVDPNAGVSRGKII